MPAILERIKREHDRLQRVLFFIMLKGKLQNNRTGMQTQVNNKEAKVFWFLSSPRVLIFFFSQEICGDRKQASMTADSTFVVKRWER